MCAAPPRREVPSPIAFNDGINIFSADQAAQRVYHDAGPQLSQLSGDHEPVAARTTHGHGSYFPFEQMSTIACRLPSRGLIIRSIPLCGG